MLAVAVYSLPAGPKCHREMVYFCTTIAYKWPCGIEYEQYEIFASFICRVKIESVCECLYIHLYTFVIDVYIWYGIIRREYLYLYVLTTLVLKSLILSPTSLFCSFTIIWTLESRIAGLQIFWNRPYSCCPFKYFQYLWRISSEQIIGVNMRADRWCHVFSSYGKTACPFIYLYIQTLKEQSHFRYP